MPGEELPGLQQGIEESLHIGFYNAWFFFIRFSEYKRKRHLPLVELADELKVYFLRLVPAVDEHEDQGEVFALTQVVINQLLPFSTSRLRDFRKSIAGQVYQVPFF